MAKFSNDDIQIPDYHIEIWKRNGEFVCDISSIVVTNIVLTKERNMSDQLHFTVDYDQFLKRLKEIYEEEDLLKPFVTEIKLIRNFEVIFGGYVSTVRVNLSQNKKRHLEIEALGYGEYLDKRLFTQAYFNMSYPDMAKAIVEGPANHEMNWITNSCFQKMGSSSIAGWHQYQGYITVGTDSVSQQQGGLQLIGTEQASHLPGYTFPTIVQGTCLTGSATIGEGSQYLSFDMIYKVYDETSNPLTRAEVNQDTDEKRKAVRLALMDKYGEPLYRHNFTIRLAFRDIVGGGFVNYVTKTITLLHRPNQTMNIKETMTDEEFAKMIDLGSANGYPVEILLTNSGYSIYINNLQLYRYIPPTVDPGNEKNLEETTMYETGLRIGYWDPELDDFPDTRIRHYEQQNAKSALYNLSKLEADNFEYRFNPDKTVDFFVYEGSKEPTIELTYPGLVQGISVSRDISTVKNVSVMTGEGPTDNYLVPAPIGVSVSSRPSISDYQSAFVSETKNYDEANTINDLYNEAVSNLQIFDQVQTVPAITLDSNHINPSNLHIGDAVILRLDVGKLFDFINGVYRVYKYTLRVSQDTVEEMEVTLLAPTFIQLQQMTLPRYLKSLENDIKRISMKSIEQYFVPDVPL